MKSYSNNDMHKKCETTELFSINGHAFSELYNEFVDSF
jgi:hypothetical protein